MNLLYGTKQGQDSVIACVSKDGNVEAKSYYNVPDGKNNLPMTVISWYKISFRLFRIFFTARLTIKVYLNKKLGFKCGFS